MTKKSTFLTILALFLLAGAGLIAWQQPAEAQRAGPYQLVAHSNETADVGIFRLNVSSGAVSFCFVRGNPPIIACTAEVQ